MNWGDAWAAFTGVGGVASVAVLIRLLPTIRKLRADTHKTVVDAALAESSADDAHLKTIVEALVNPLRTEVERLHGEIRDLRAEVTELRGVQRRYYRLLDWARSVLAWAKGWHAEADPPLPTIPADISEDI